MDKVIYKYPFGRGSSAGVGRFMLPIGAKPLSVGEQQGQLVLWAEVDPSAELTPWYMTVVYTELGTPPDDAQFMGTVTMDGGIVCHVYAQEDI